MHKFLSNPNLQRPAPRVLFFGMEGRFSVPVLAALLDHGIDVCAVILPAIPFPGTIPRPLVRKEPPRRGTVLPLLTSTHHLSIMQTAWKKEIPVWEVARLGHAETIKTLAAYQPDLICVACFSQRIPRVLIDLPRLACLNVHPSLLPANRGPVPLFWTLYAGDAMTGVTVHLVEEKMDSGAIVAQEEIAVPDGTRYSQLESRCAMLGADLLVRSVWQLYRGEASLVPQNEALSSYHSFPTPEDFCLDIGQWTARRLYNFVCGIREWEEPIGIQIEGRRYIVLQSLAYGNQMKDDGSDSVWEGKEVVVRCQQGWVRLAVSPEPL